MQAQNDTYINAQAVLLHPCVWLYMDTNAEGAQCRQAPNGERIAEPDRALETSRCLSANASALSVSLLRCAMAASDEHPYEVLRVGKPAACLTRPNRGEHIATKREAEPGTNAPRPPLRFARPHTSLRLARNVWHATYAKMPRRTAPATSGHFRAEPKTDRGLSLRKVGGRRRPENHAKWSGRRNHLVAGAGMHGQTRPATTSRSDDGCAHTRGNCLVAVGPRAWRDTRPTRQCIASPHTVRRCRDNAVRFAPGRGRIGNIRRRDDNAI